MSLSRRFRAWWIRRFGLWRGLAARADYARELGRPLDAAALYREALAFAPEHPGLHIQAGHMLKEAGALAAADAHYRRAEQISPGDADLALQQGHLHKLAGRPEAAAQAYRRAFRLDPTLADARGELAALDPPA